MVEGYSTHVFRCEQRCANIRSCSSMPGRVARGGARHTHLTTRFQLRSPASVLFLETANSETVHVEEGNAMRNRNRLEMECFSCPQEQFTIINPLCRSMDSKNISDQERCFFLRLKNGEQLNTVYVVISVGYISTWPLRHVEGTKGGVQWGRPGPTF